MFATILGEEDVKGPDRLEILELVCLEAEPTELARRLGELSGGSKQNGSYWIIPKGTYDGFYDPEEDFEDSEYINAVSGNNNLLAEDEGDPGIGIRPYLEAVGEEETKNCKTHLRKLPNGKKVKVKEFGEYPQTFVNESEIGYDALQPTGKIYTFDAQESSIEFLPMPCSEYQDTKTGNKYIQIQTDVVEIDDGIGTEHNYVNVPIMKWVKVEPITWIEDPKSHSMISEKVMVAGINPIYRFFCKADYVAEILGKEMLPPDEYLKTIENLRPDDNYFEWTKLRKEDFAKYLRHNAVNSETKNPVEAGLSQVVSNTKIHGR